MEPPTLRPSSLNLGASRSRRPYFIIALSILGLIAVSALVLFFRFKSQPQGDYAFAAPVTTAPVEIRNLPIKYATVGSLAAEKRVDLNVELPGVIRELYFQEGQWVNQGMPLLQLKYDKQSADLEERQYSAAEAEAVLASTNAEYQAQKQSLKQVETQRDLARTEYNRYKALFDKEFVSAEQLDQKQAAMEVAEASFAAAGEQLKSLLARRDQAKAGIAAAKARAASVRTDFTDTILRAPFSGQIGTKFVNEGDYVVPTEKILTLVQSNPLKISVNVPERYLPALRQNGAVEVETESYPGKVFHGRIYFINPVVSPASRSVLVKARVENLENKLQPGQYANVRLILGTSENAMVIPEESVIPQGERYFVYVAEGDKAFYKPVEIGQRLSGWVEIIKGITPKSRVVTGGIQKLRDGSDIKEIEASGPQTDPDSADVNVPAAD